MNRNKGTDDLQQKLMQLESFLGVQTEQPQGGAVAPSASMGGTIGSSVKNAQKATMESYGEKLAKRATPDMNAQ